MPFIPFYHRKALRLSFIRTVKKAPEAARVMKVTAADLKELGLIERIIPEEEPANTDTLYRIAGYMDRSMIGFMKKYQDMSGEELAEHRYERFRRM